MNIATAPVRLAGVSEEEWKIRCDLAALYRLIAHFRWTDHVYTHLSARLPGPDHHFLINQYGVHFHEMRASDLVKIDLHGNVVENDPNRSTNVNAAGFTIHSAVHMARKDLMCVVHTHTAAGIAVSAQEEGLLPLSQHSMRFIGHIGYHDYEGVALDLGERERLIRDLGAHQVMVLRNHGLLMGGSNIQEAFHNTYMLERACAAQIAAQAGGAKLRYPAQEVIDRTAAYFNKPKEPSAYDMFWDASLRLIENDKPDYRT